MGSVDSHSEVNARSLLTSGRRAAAAVAGVAALQIGCIQIVIGQRTVRAL